jgi:hypothetical protein
MIARRSDLGETRVRSGQLVVRLGSVALSSILLVLD